MRTKNNLIKVLAILIVCISNIGYAQVAPPAQYGTASSNFVRTWTATAPQTDPAVLLTVSLREAKQTTAFFDGLGRPLQTVAKQASLATGGTATDMVSSNVYDAYGREQYKYLPFAANNIGGNTSITDGNFKLNPFQQQAAFLLSSNTASPITGQGETYFYSKTNFEASPLNRPTETYAPGNNWVGTEGTTKNGTKINYYINTITDAVRICNVTPGAIGSFSTYASTLTYEAGTLYKTITVDEKNNQVIEFKDIEGKIILKKAQLTAVADNGTGSAHPGWLCTYYLYDDLNNLRCVIQPKGVELVSATSWALTDATILAEQCFRYEYDQRNRMIMKKVPGAGEVYMVYDGRDRLIMMQDANMRTSTQWLVTLYDDLNRPLQTGKFTTASTFVALLGAAYTAGANIVTAYPFANNTTPTGSTWENVTITHYDDYAGLPAGLTASLYSSGYTTYLTASATSPDYAEPITQSLAVNGMATWTSVKVLGTASQYISTVNIYDLKGRVLQTQTVNVSNGLDVITNQYSFSNQILRSHINHKKPGTLLQTYDVATKNTYDDLSRVITIEKNLNNGGWKAINSLTYNALGQLSTKKLSPAFNSGAGLESLTYDYNIRGWLLGENRNFVQDLNTTNYFGFDLGYDKNGSLANYTPQYNGNISGTIWKSKGDNQKRKYDFTYDVVNRLSGATFGQYVSGSGTSAVFDGTTAGVNFSVENLTYDANGNILTMWQKGLKLTTSDYINKLGYNYYSNSNKLLNVIDAVNDNTTKLGNFRASALYQSTMPTKTATTTADYTYDVNGNLTKDYNKDIVTAAGTDGIQYNYLNLPSVITVKNSNTTNKGTITYIYDAAGNKLMKTTVEIANAANINISTTTTTTYIGGFVYETKIHVPSQTTDYTDVLQFIGQEEGRIRKKTDGTFVYDYFLKDHLGNVRMVLTEEVQQDKYPVASLEPTKIATEKLYYDIKDAQVVDKATATGITDYINDNGIGNNPTDAAFSATYSTKLYQLNSNTAKTGLGITLKVMAGDKIDVFGKSYYFTNTAGTSGNSTVPIIDLLTAFLSAPAAAATTAGHGLITPAIINTPTGITGITNMATLQNSQSNTTPTKPRAFINVIFFDEQFKAFDYRISMVGTNSVVKDHFTDLQNLLATKTGYVYIYCSNESPVNVYFDNLQVVQTRGPILSEDSYYPFGLQMSGLCSRAAGKLENRRKFNDGTELNTDFDLNLYETDFRSYDPQIGRFHQIDELTEFDLDWSPYVYAHNNPILLNDPLGLTADTAWKPLPEVIVTSKPKNASVGQPGLGESLIPVWGSARAAVDDFQNGRWGWGIFNSVMAISDVFLIKSAITAVGKLIVKGAAEVITKEAAKEGVYVITTKSGRYIGQSKHFLKRIIQHFGKGGKLSLETLEKVLTHEMAGSTKLEREVYEQYLIREAGGVDALINKVNPMGGRMDKYFEMIDGVIEKFGLPK